MSYWTHVNGNIIVDVFGRTQEESEYILKTVLKHLPVVTGSESDMDVFIQRQSGTSMSSSQDEYGMTTNNLVDDYGDRSRNRGWLNVQTKYILTVQGDLRDRVFDDTFKEFMNWICRLSKRVSVESVLVRIEAEYNNKTITLDYYGYDKNPFIQMEECDAWEDDNHIPSWTEHLLWRPHKGYTMPLSLLYKYYPDDPEFRKEWLKRYEGDDKNDKTN